MKLRTQWIVAFVLLAVAPLGAITIYSYVSSARALRRTVEAESARLAEEMNTRMAVVTANLSRRIDLLESLPYPEPPAGSAAAQDKGPDPILLGRMVAALGDAADYIDAFEFTPAEEPPSPPQPPEPGAPGAVVHGGHPQAQDGKSAPGAAPPTPRTPVVIPLPRIVGEIAKNPKMAPVMKFASEFLPPEEAQRVKKELEQSLGQNGQEILRVIKEKIEAEMQARRVEAEKKEKQGKEQETTAVYALRQEFGCPLKHNGQTVGHLKAKVSAARLLHEVLSQTKREQGEIPFAIDASGKLYTPDPDDTAALRALELAAVSGRARAVKAQTVVPASNPSEGSSDEDDPDSGDQQVRLDVKRNQNWVVVTREAPATGLVFGIARPVGAALGEIRRAAARNLGAGMGLAVLALFAVVPISRRMTHNLSDLTRAASEVAAGRLDVQVPVRSRDELGQLALTFNRMARDLAANQERLVEQERLRKELELCRRIQSELLPKKPLSFPFAEVQGLSIPAHELGGDFFNYFDLPSGEVALFMGDVSGKGVPAALLMANLQATLRARVPLQPDLAEFARQLDHEVEASTPPEVYLTLFLAVLDPRKRELRYINAGHESPFLLRGDGRLERLDSTGRPIGLLSGGEYGERRVTLATGDRLFLYTDGLVDAENESGAQFGQKRLEALLARDSAADPGTLLTHVERAYQDHRSGREAADDATLLVLRVGNWLQARPEIDLRPKVRPGPESAAAI